MYKIVQKTVNGVGINRFVITSYIKSDNTNTNLELAKLDNLSLESVLKFLKTTPDYDFALLILQQEHTLYLTEKLEIIPCSIAVKHNNHITKLTGNKLPC